MADKSLNTSTFTALIMLACIAFVAVLPATCNEIIKSSTRVRPAGFPSEEEALFDMANGGLRLPRLYLTWPRKRSRRILLLCMAAAGACLTRRLPVTVTTMLVDVPSPSPHPRVWPASAITITGGHAAAWLSPAPEPSLPSARLQTNPSAPASREGVIAGDTRTHATATIMLEAARSPQLLPGALPATAATRVPGPVVEA